MDSETFDYVVVGAGSAGAIVASRLAEAGASVLVLESGGTDRRLDVRIPAAVSRAYRTANWMYRVEPDPSRVGEQDTWMAGKIVGGSGSINACIYVRGNRADFDGWAKLGCAGWDYDSVLPAFKRMETWAQGETEYRGADGPIHVGLQTDWGQATQAFVEATKQAGYPFNPDYNAESQEGVGVIQVNHRRGTRSQASREYFRQVAPKNRLTLRRRSTARRILFQSDRACGVEYEHKGELRHALATCEVIVSAGALASPKLLLLSGIGPAAELDRFGVPAVFDSPEVGANLQEHATLQQRWHANIRTLNNLRPSDIAAAGIAYLLRGTGLLALPIIQAHAIAKSEPTIDAPNLQIQFQSFVTERVTAQDGRSTFRRSRENGFQPASTLVRPRARGRVSLRSGDPNDPPLIEHQFLHHRDDLRDIIAGARELRRIMEQPAMAPIVGEQFDPEGQCHTDEEWADFARGAVRGLQHSAGTCRMGDDDRAVVDPELRVRGTSRLRVVDASIMPTVTTGNTNAPSMMIGERAAEIILD